MVLQGGRVASFLCFKIKKLKNIWMVEENLKE